MKKVFQLSYSLFFISYSLLSCSASKQISKQADQLLLKDAAISQGHIGISVFDPSTGKYLYNHNADKYFIPASNTKLFSWYAGMKYLGDSLVGMHYFIEDSSLIFQPSGDPTFLLPEFKSQNVYSFLSKWKGDIYFTERNKSLSLNPFGQGWQIDDVGETYQVARSTFPIYGNLVTVTITDDGIIDAIPGFFKSTIRRMGQATKGDKLLQIKKYDSYGNNYLALTGNRGSNKLQVPFTPTTGLSILNLLKDTIRKEIHPDILKSSDNWAKLYSQPSDSLFKPMMHRSDNFFAEQTLLMASNEFLGYMSDRDMIDTILKTELKDIPRQPRWVDGSGLSRYNLFTPKDFVWLLNKIKNEFSWERIKNILPTGGEGTLSSYYKSEAGFIYAKTGTLSNNCALSGYLITKKNKVLIFSVLVNNYPTGATPVRRAVEKFIKNLREKY